MHARTRTHTYLFANLFKMSCLNIKKKKINKRKNNLYY